MANNEDDIRKLMREQFGGSKATVLGKVKDIDESTRTCTVEDDGLEMPGIRLQCITDGCKGIVVYPKVGAQALAVCVEGSEEWMVVACSEIDTMRIDVGQSSIEVKDGEIIINGGSVGMTKTDKLTEKINALEKRCNDIVTALQGVTITLAPTGTFPLAPYFTMSPMTTTPQTDLEDTKIKH